MQIELPQDVIERATRLASGSEDAATVLARALDALERERHETAAVRAGIDAYERGDHEPWNDFAQRFAAEHGIALEP